MGGDTTRWKDRYSATVSEPQTRAAGEPRNQRFEPKLLPPASRNGWVKIAPLVGVVGFGVLLVVAAIYQALAGSRSYNGEGVVARLLQSAPFLLGLIIVVFAGLAAMAFTLFRASTVGDLATKEAQEAADHELERISGPNDVLGLMRYNRSQMEAYDTAAREQAKRSNLAALMSMTVGFVTVLVGFIFAATASHDSGRLTVGMVSLLGTVTSGYVAKTFLENARKSTEAALYYFQNPLATSYLLAAERLASTLPEEQRPTQVAGIIKAALDQAESSARTAHPRDVNR